MSEFAVLTNPELDALEVLTEYKDALVLTNHRSAWHRFLCWCGDPEATRAEHALAVARRHVRAVARRSDAHLRAVRAVAALQQHSTREEEGFLAQLRA